MIARLVGMAVLASLAPRPARASVAGPAAPAAVRTTPAQQAIALYRSEWSNAPPPKPCPPSRDATGEIVVCAVPGRGGSPDRLPLPEERGPPAVRVAIGELPSAARVFALAQPHACGGMGCGDGGSVSLLKAAGMSLQLLRAVFDPEAASDHADAHPEEFKSK